jgi:drug/metabolite transporter (DMT)-like permease
MAFYAQLMFIVVSALIGLLVGDGRFAVDDNPTLNFLLRAWVWPSDRDLILLAGVGTLSGIGAYLISQGYRITEASLVAPFEYAALPSAMAWSILFFGDWPDNWSWLGITLILGAGLYAFFQSNVQGRNR